MQCDDYVCTEESTLAKYTKWVKLNTINQKAIDLHECRTAICLQMAT